MILAGTLSALVLAPAAEAYPGAPWFRPSVVYTGNFPDPSVVVVGRSYVAYATTTGGAYLPAETSTDLVHWTARPSYDPGAPGNADPYFNDALPRPARWGVNQGNGRLTKTLVAPGVARIGGQWHAYYAVLVRQSPPRFCLSVATATSALGPFTDNSTRPLSCDLDPAGSLDPQPFVDPATGQAWLTWKSEGVPGHLPTRLWSQKLDATGRLATGSTPKELLRTALPWEGNVIESPSMVRWAGSYWLFYSGNEWASSHYAIGYARCSSPAGPCRRGSATPLLASTSTRLGPGGETAFVDLTGRLRLAHHYWNAPYTHYPSYPQCQQTATCTTQGQRRLAVETLIPRGTGLGLS